MNIALVTEGISEYRVIKSFLNKYLKNDEDDIDVNQIQPEIENDKQVTGGGWNEVLKFCGSADRIINAFNYNELLVIQIDTDLCQNAPFSVEHSINGNLKSHETLYEDVKQRLVNEIPNELYEKYKNRIVFAISTHTIECWLLPIYVITKIKKGAINNCILALNSGLARRDFDVIPARKNSPNAIKAYNGLLRPIKKKDIIMSAGIHFGLNKFLNDLDAADKTQIESDT